jgi:asparagine synthase (glutamine-hydrolysing)
VRFEDALEWGLEALLPRLDGMFVFAVLDTVSVRIQLTRHRFGTKPLYLYEESDFVASASEIKAFRLWVELEPEAFAIGTYLLGFGGPMRRQTIYRRVRIFGTGTSVEIGL